MKREGSADRWKPARDTDAHDRAPADGFGTMSREAQRLLVDRSRWWLHDDGGLSLRIIAGPDERAASMELCEVFTAVLGLEFLTDELDGDLEPPPDDPGLTFDEVRSRLDQRRSS